jgi:WD40 repeat protein
MKVSIDPFLVSRNHYLDYRTVVAPNFLLESGMSSLLARITEGDLTLPETAIYREVKSSSVGTFAVIFQVVKATQADIGYESDEILKDPFGREIYLIEGFVVRESYQNPLFSSTIMSAVHKCIMEAYQQFWQLTEPAPAQSVSSLEVFGSDSEQLLVLKNLDPFVVDDSKFLVTRAGNKLVHKHTIETEFGISSVAFSPDGECLAARYDNQQVQQWSLTDLDHPQTLLKVTSDEFLSQISYSPDGKLIACGSYLGGLLQRRNTIWRWNRCANRDDKPLYERSSRELELNPRTLLAVTFSPNSRLLAAGTKEGRILVWNLEQGDNKELLTGNLTAVNAIAFSPDGEMLVSGEQDGTIRCWTIDSPLDLPPFADKLPPITSLAFSPTGKLLACGCASDNTQTSSCVLWDVATQEPRISFKLNEGTSSSSINSIAFSPDSRLLAMAGRDGSIHLLDVEKERKVFSTTAHQGSVTSVAFCLKKRTLASASSDGKIKLWELG